MIYLKVHWDHDSEIRPVAFYCEMEDDRMEVRKVELFADGSFGYANERRSSGKTTLGALPTAERARRATSITCGL